MVRLRGEVTASYGRTRTARSVPRGLYSQGGGSLASPLPSPTGLSSPHRLTCKANGLDSHHSSAGLGAQGGPWAGPQRGPGVLEGGAGREAAAETGAGGAVPRHAPLSGGRKTGGSPEWGGWGGGAEENSG